MNGSAIIGLAIRQLVSAMIFRVLSVVFFAFPIMTSAHHSRAEYSGEPIEFQGSLVDILWRNPHPAFTVEVNGQSQTWQVEGWSSLYTFDRAGITQDRFALGDTVRVYGLASNRRPGRFLATHMLLADGTEAILRREEDPYWGESQRLGGQELWAIETGASVVDAAAENRGIFRVWSYPSPNVQTVQHLPLTAAAEAARAEWDPVDNYVMRCEQKTMPGSMLTPNPYEFIDNGDTITVRGHEGDVVRTVHLSDAGDPGSQPVDTATRASNSDAAPATRPSGAGAAPTARSSNPDAAPATGPYSLQGYSVGRWEDDRTLVIHTSRINAGYLGFTGIQLSDEVEVVERYTLSEDQTRLNFHITTTDPQTFTEPATAEYYWLALGESFGQYDCGVH